jgi:hypothetical protein
MRRFLLVRLAPGTKTELTKDLVTHTLSIPSRTVLRTNGYRVFATVVFEGEDSRIEAGGER